MNREFIEYGIWNGDVEWALYSCVQDDTNVEAVHYRVDMNVKEEDRSVFPGR